VPGPPWRVVRVCPRGGGGAAAFEARADAERQRDAQIVHHRHHFELPTLSVSGKRNFQARDEEGEKAPKL